MTVISNDPSWWPTINSYRFYSYFVVASLTAAVYDWVLTFGQEVELVWKQRWSLMTALYLGVRCVGIVHSVIMLFVYLPSVSVTDIGCTTLLQAQSWIGFVISAMLGVIMITRLHAMYQRSRKMLIFLIVIFVALMIACRVNAAIGMSSLSGEEFVLSGIHCCVLEGDNGILMLNTWILKTLWEVLALCLAAWIAVKHFHELRRFGSSTGLTIRDYVTVLLRTHIGYFAAFTAVSCLVLGSLSPNILGSSSVGAAIYYGILQSSMFMQTCILGPRLILSIREYHVKANPTEGPSMVSMVFQERIQLTDGGDWHGNAQMNEHF